MVYTFLKMQLNTLNPKDQNKKQNSSIFKYLDLEFRNWDLIVQSEVYYEGLYN